MSKNGLSRRQFLGGAAVVAAASAMPLITSASTAVATPTNVFPAPLTTWVPLDATAAARFALEIYRGKHAGNGG